MASNNFYNNYVIVEKHYIPNNIYREIYTPTPTNASTQSNLHNSTVRPDVRPESRIPTRNASTSIFDFLRGNGYRTEIPLDIEITNFTTSPINLFDNFENIFNTTSRGISLSNINIYTTVSRFSDIIQPSTDSCTICQHNFESSDICRIVNQCNHIFHLQCVDQWLANNITCPYCRFDLTSSRPNTNITSTATTTTSTPTSSATATPTATTVNVSVSRIENNESLNESLNEDISDNDTGDDESYYDNSDDDSLTSSTNTQPPTTSTNTVFTSNTATAFTITQPVVSDIHNFINMTTPFFNNFVSGTSNGSVSIDSTVINGQVDNVIDSINPILSIFGNLINNAQNASHARHPPPRR